MNETIKMIHRDHTGKLSDVSAFSAQVADTVTNYHKSFPTYQVTPLADLKNLAAALGLSSLHVKDESYRFGINAFKGLGGSFCLGNYMAHKLNKPISELPYDVLTSEETKKAIGQITFVTATDVNHGRGIAWTAQQLGQKAVIYMPKGSSPEQIGRAHV